MIQFVSSLRVYTAHFLVAAVAWQALPSAVWAKDARDEIPIKVCSQWKPVSGIRGLKVIQTPAFETGASRIEIALALLALIEKSSAPLDLEYIGLKPSDDWSRCGGEQPTILFGRNTKGEWEHVPRTLRRFLEKQVSSLREELIGSPEEAYWLIKLAEVRGDAARLALMNRAFLILESEGDPRRAMVGLVASLMGSIRPRLQPEMVSRYLDAYAKVAEAQSKWGGDLMVLVKEPSVFPKKAEQARKEGYVVVEYTVDAAGVVRDPIVVEQTPKGWFDKEAIRSTKKYRYLPKVIGGKRVASKGERATVEFLLGGS